MSEKKAERKAIGLPAPEMWILQEHDVYSLAHEMEQCINFYRVDEETGEEYDIAPPMDFVRHYMHYRDSKVTVVTAIVTSPLVLPDGTLLARQGKDRERGWLFKLQPELVAILPRPEECGDEAVRDAMNFLTDEWLCDVATDHAGKCVLLASAMSILERTLLAERPAFIITAGKRGSGKTTALHMVFVAATGHMAAAAAWSADAEERRKALFSYLGQGVAAVCWDNIPRGTMVSCPSIEKSLTSLLYEDRVLGMTGTRTVPATTVNFFTGNNIGAKGDMASRSFTVRLTTDRPDPEERRFKHADPVQWTFDHRGNILQALYTIMLGNPRLKLSREALEENPAETRFKTWWTLVGAAVEHAARLCGQSVRFRDLILAEEAEDEHQSATADVLRALRAKWPKWAFQAADVVSELLNDVDFTGRPTAAAISFKATLEQASEKALPVVTSRLVTWRLKAILREPVVVDGETLELRYEANKSGDGGKFKVVVLAGKPTKPEAEREPEGEPQSQMPF